MAVVLNSDVFITIKGRQRTEKVTVDERLTWLPTTEEIAASPLRIVAMQNLTHDMSVSCHERHF